MHKYFTFFVNIFLDFTLSELAICRSLPQSEDTLTQRKVKDQQQDQDEIVPVGISKSSLTSESISPVADDIEYHDDKISTVRDLLRSDEKYPREELIIINEENDQLPVQNKELQNQFSSNEKDIGQPSTDRKTVDEIQTLTKATIESFIFKQSCDEPLQGGSTDMDPLSVLNETTQDRVNEIAVPSNVFSGPAQKNEVLTYAGLFLTNNLQY